MLEGIAYQLGQRSGLRLLEIHIAAEAVCDGLRRGRQLQLGCFKHSR